jgi:hypothetical protein
MNNLEDQRFLPLACNVHYQLGLLSVADQYIEGA